MLSEICYGVVGVVTVVSAVVVVSTVAVDAGSAAAVVIIPRASVRANIDSKRAYRAASAAWAILLRICGSAIGSGWASAVA